MSGDIAGRTNLSSLSLDGGLDVGSQVSLGAGKVSITSLGRLTLSSGATLQVGSGATTTYAAGSSLVVGSGATVTYQTGMMWSMATIGTAASLSSLAGLGFQLGIFFGASGCSLIGRSGNTIYTIGTSAVSAAAP